MADDRLPRRSELFTIRIWPEELGEGQIEWRGRIQHALSGRTSYFREWSALLAFLAEFVAADAALSAPLTET